MSYAAFRRVYGEGPAEVQALRDVDLSVDAGVLVAVMGPSGSGKSTLLTIAGSLEEPTSGQVLVEGATLSTMSRNDKARLRRRSIGYVFQDFNLLPGLTAAENVSLPLELDGIGAGKARTVGLKALDELGLGDQASRFPDQLSGGERQRVAIARAVVGERHLLLADEPSGALDSANGDAVMRLLVAACHRGVAAVVVLVADGAAVGVIGALAGVVIGLAAWTAYAPYFGRSADHLVVWTDLPWWLVATAAVLAIVTAVLAARHPARNVAGMPVVATLSGRPAEPKQSQRSPRPGLIVLGLGLVLLAFSGGFDASGSSANLDTLGGLLATIAAVVLLAPHAMARLEPVARRAPVAVRIALRDLARYRVRSGAALAAASIAVFIAMLIALLATGRYAEPLAYFGPNLPPDQLIVYTPANGPGTMGSGTVLPSAQQRLTGQATANRIAASLDTGNVLTLEAPTAPTDVLLSRVGSRSEVTVSSIYVATPALLSHYGISPAAIDSGTVFITSRPGLQGTSNLLMQYGNFLANNAVLKSVPDPQIQTFGTLPASTSEPNLLITTYAVAKLGLRTAPVAWLIQAPRALTPLQVNTARQVASGVGLTIETKSGAPSLDEVRDDATAIGVLVALGVLAMTLGLIRSETAGDLRTLTATGAGGRTRRAIAAATAGALGVLGALIGTAVAYLAVVAFSWHDLLSRPVSIFPVTDLLLVLLGLPLLAAAVGWIFAGRQPSAMARQPLE